MPITRETITIIILIYARWQTCRHGLNSAYQKCGISTAMSNLFIPTLLRAHVLGEPRRMCYRCLKASPNLVRSGHFTSTSVERTARVQHVIE